jgi:hypothetical protein
MEARFVVEAASDLDTLERAIRRLLRCDGAVCAFLESAPYRMLRVHILRRLGGADCEGVVRLFPHSTFMVTVTDAHVVEISSRVPPLEPVCGVVGRPRKERAWDEYVFSRRTKRSREEEA